MTNEELLNKLSELEEKFRSGKEEVEALGKDIFDRIDAAVIRIMDAREDEALQYSGYSKYLDEFFKKVECERVYQQEKWGDAFDAKNNRNDWTAYISGYLGRVFEASTLDELDEALVKVATLCAAAFEWNQRGMPLRHYDPQSAVLLNE
jgi:hypothetical protein